MAFKNRVVLIGFGVVARALLPLLIKHLRVAPARMVVIDFADREAVLQPWIAEGLTFVRERVTPLSLSRLLSSHAARGDLIIDLAWSVDFFDIARWALENGVIYVNASLEAWDAGEERPRRTLVEASLYVRYAQLLQWRERWRGATTVLVDQGANPGLVSAFVKAGLLDLAAAAIAEGKVPAGPAEQLQRLIESEDFAELAHTLGVKVIHCSEWDTQRSRVSKSPDEFVSTWSAEAMWEESISPSELGWGTHEKQLPPGAIRPDFGPGNQIILPQRGLNTWVRSWVPNQEIVGMVMAHGESFGLAHALTVRRDGRPLYRPTVNYAYVPCADSLVSLHELRARDYALHPKTRTPTNEIVDGADVVGALIMGHPLGAWWTGSMLTIDEARQKVPGANATTLQVAAGMLAATLWALRNPWAGPCLPEDLPHREILAAAGPYLGRFVSVKSDWTPLRGRHDGFGDESPNAVDPSDPWQFRNFVFRP